MSSAFDLQMNDAQTAWRARHVHTQAHGSQNGFRRAWILPKCDWEEGLWPGIRSGTPNSLRAYVGNDIQMHHGVHNLKSSWMLCANLYFAHRHDLRLLAAFLSDRIDNRIVEIRELELEWAECPPHDPATLLGEPKGKRGANQTSPDIAFVVGLKGGGQGLILTENKFVEHSFYPCSGRKKKYKNPDPRRCLDAKLVLDDLDTQCHLLNWETDGRTNRRYWDYVHISDDPVPEPVEPGLAAMPALAGRRKHPDTGAVQGVENVPGGPGQPDRPGTRLRVSEEQMALAVVGPAQREDLSLAASGEKKKTDDGDLLRAPQGMIRQHPGQPADLFVRQPRVRRGPSFPL